MSACDHGCNDHAAYSMLLTQYYILKIINNNKNPTMTVTKMRITILFYRIYGMK